MSYEFLFRITFNHCQTDDQTFDSGIDKLVPKFLMQNRHYIYLTFSLFITWSNHIQKNIGSLSCLMPCPALSCLMLLGQVSMETLAPCCYGSPAPGVSGNWPQQYRQGLLGNWVCHGPDFAHPWTRLIMWDLILSIRRLSMCLCHPLETVDTLDRGYNNPPGSSCCFFLT